MCRSRSKSRKCTSALSVRIQQMNHEIVIRSHSSSVDCAANVHQKTSLVHSSPQCPSKPAFLFEEKSLWSAASLIPGLPSSTALCSSLQQVLLLTRQEPCGFRACAYMYRPWPCHVLLSCVCESALCLTSETVCVWSYRFAG